ncbi:MAG: hypothetical protein KZQ99_02370 [Candidatus Thiodiazotropha sp. (ex Dulcina madagascariensis)]|nr:hypothetical protein [Candidatus Thiodiazotropha sp. (ex Dulcina madagascariensis)]
MEPRAGTTVKLCCLETTSKKNHKADIRKEKIRWANKTATIIKVDLAMEYVADVLEAEVENLQAIQITEAHDSAMQLIRVIGYLRQQTENLRG